MINNISTGVIRRLPRSTLSQFVLTFKLIEKFNLSVKLLPGFIMINSYKVTKCCFMRNFVLETLVGSAHADASRHTGPEIKINF